MHRNHLWLSGLACVLLSVPTAACIQSYVAKPKQQLPADIFHLHVSLTPQPLTMELSLPGGATKVKLSSAAQDPADQFTTIIADYEADPNKARSFRDRNDYAAALLFAGQYDRAVATLLKIEHDYPGEYATASNLGTAYELIGDVDNALAWIRRGVERNPDSHSGTEWLHVAILETKQKLKRDPLWLSTHSVLDGHEGRDRAEKLRALEYQLNERLYFIHENDKIMCDLFYQAARLTEESAKRIYFLRQVPRFGSIRDEQVRKLQRG